MHYFHYYPVKMEISQKAFVIHKENQKHWNIQFIFAYDTAVE